MRWCTLGLLACALAVSCGPNVFACQDDEQCVEAGVHGVCQVGGGCSFPDDACPTGQRYGQHSGGGLAGECVPAGDGTTTTTSASTSGSASGSSGSATTLTTSASATTTTGDPVTSGPTATTDPPTSGTGSSGAASITVGMTTGPPLEGCDLYCSVKENCNFAGDACIQQCESGLEFGEGFGDDCADALENLMDCRSGLTCGDLSLALEDPLESACTSQVVAVGTACPNQGCVGLCGAFDACMLDFGDPDTPCPDACSGPIMSSLLEGGGAACYQAHDDFIDCLTPLDCPTLTDIFVNGNLVACDQFLSTIGMTCG